MEISNYSDLEIVVQFKDKTTGQLMGVPTSDFMLSYYVYTNKVRSIEQRGGVLPDNCKVDEEGKLHIYFDSPQFGNGRLRTRHTISLKDEGFADKKRTIVREGLLDVNIVERTNGADTDDPIITDVVKAEDEVYLDLKMETYQTFTEKLKGIEDSVRQSVERAEGASNQVGAFEERITTTNNKTEDNARAITDLTGKVQLNTTKTEEQGGKITSLETLTTTHTEQLTTLNSKIENNKSVVVNLGAKVEELEPIIRANTTKNSEQDQRLTAIEGKEQSTTSKVDALRDIVDERLHDIDRLKGLNSTVEEHISQITAIKAKNTQQDERLTAIEASTGQSVDLEPINTEITNIKAKNTEQDERLTALESRPSTGGEGTPLDTPTAEDVVAMRAQIANLTRLYEALNLDPEKKKN